MNEGHFIKVHEREIPPRRGFRYATEVEECGVGANTEHFLSLRTVPVHTDD